MKPFVRRLMRVANSCVCIERHAWVISQIIILIIPGNVERSRSPCPTEHNQSCPDNYRTHRTMGL